MSSASLAACRGRGSSAKWQKTTASVSPPTAPSLRLFRHVRAWREHRTHDQRQGPAHRVWNSPAAWMLGAIGDGIRRKRRQWALPVTSTTASVSPPTAPPRPRDCEGGTSSVGLNPSGVHSKIHATIMATGKPSAREMTTPSGPPRMECRRREDSRRDLDQEPGDDAVSRGRAVDVASLEFTEKIARIHGCLTPASRTAHPSLNGKRVVVANSKAGRKTVRASSRCHNRRKRLV